MGLGVWAKREVSGARNDPARPSHPWEEGRCREVSTGAQRCPRSIRRPEVAGEVPSAVWGAIRPHRARGFGVRLWLRARRGSLRRGEDVGVRRGDVRRVVWLGCLGSIPGLSSVGATERELVGWGVVTGRCGGWLGRLRGGVRRSGRGLSRLRVTTRVPPGLSRQSVREAGAGWWSETWICGRGVWQLTRPCGAVQSAARRALPLNLGGPNPVPAGPTSPAQTHRPTATRVQGRSSWPPEPASRWTGVRRWRWVGQKRSLRQQR